jgi:hypothetical protein
LRNLDYPGAAQALAQLGSRAAVTPKADSADVGEVAFAAALGNGQDMIGVPKRTALARLETPFRPAEDAARPAQTLESSPLRYTVESTLGADAAIARKNLFPKVARIAAETPFVHAEVRAKRAAAGRDFEAAPPAEIATMRSFGKGAGVDPAAWHRAGSAHGNILDHLCSTVWTVS